MCSSGNMPAHATAKIVIASANRLIDVRHSCCSSSRIAEISVPAWPMPIHQTKLMIAKPQATGMLMPQMPTPRADQLGHRRPCSMLSEPERDQRSRRTSRCVIRRVSTMRDDLVGDRSKACVRPDGASRAIWHGVGQALPSAGHDMSLRHWLQLRIAGCVDARQVGRSRPRVQLGQQAVIAAVRRFSLRHPRLLRRSGRQRRSPRSGRPAGRRS